MTPPLYIEENSRSFAAISGPPETVAVIIGYTPAGTEHTLQPVNVDSLQQYIDTFGQESYTPSGMHFPLWVHLQLYFANGGRKCWVVSTGQDYTKKAAVGTTGHPGLLDGLRAAEAIGDAQLLVVPEAVELSLAEYAIVVQSMLEHCSRMPNRFALIDVRGGHAEDTATLQEFYSAVGSAHLRYGAAYYPFLVTTDPGTGAGVAVPPGAAIAGIIATIDQQRGIWKAPANRALQQIQALALQITKPQQDALQGDRMGHPSINAIRTFGANDHRVWGARTLETNDRERLYISVQRMIMTVSAAIKEALEPYIFENNVATTWTAVRARVENYLMQYWKNGALQGSRVQEAFFVRVGLGQTMTQADIDAGNLIVEIGMALIRPAEFIILRFLQTTRK